MARRFASLVAASLLFHAACSGGAGDDPEPDARDVRCAVSADCGTGNWCNPLVGLCEPRASNFGFDRDVYPMIRDVCAACHAPGGPGATDSLGTGTIALFSEGPGQAHASLVAGGTACAIRPGRLCVDEPKDSLAVIRVLPGHELPGQTFVLPDGYADPWMQTFLHWIAAGAERDPSTIPDAGVVDAPPSLPDGPVAPPDAPSVVDASPAPPDAPGVPDAAPRPDAAVPDTTPPIGGGVDSAVSDSCGLVTLTLAPTTDDQTPPSGIAHEICWSSTPGGCLSGFVTMQTIEGTGPYRIDLSASDGTTLFVAARARDDEGNVNAAGENVAVAIPSFLSWPAGGVAVQLASTPGQYQVSWPAAASLCPSLGPLQLQACAGASCQAVTGSPVTLTASCATTTFSVRATAGHTTVTRSASRAWTVAFAAIQTEYANRCPACHNSGFPSLTRNDIDHPSALCSGKVLISAGNPAASQIYSVARDRAYLCGGTHFNHTMTSPEAELLRCWIEQGAPP